MVPHVAPLREQSPRVDDRHVRRHLWYRPRHGDALLVDAREMEVLRDRDAASEAVAAQTGAPPRAIEPTPYTAPQDEPQSLATFVPTLGRVIRYGLPFGVAWLTPLEAELVWARDEHASTRA